MQRDFLQRSILFFDVMAGSWEENWYRGHWELCYFSTPICTYTPWGCSWMYCTLKSFIEIGIVHQSHIHFFDSGNMYMSFYVGESCYSWVHALRTAYSIIQRDFLILFFMIRTVNWKGRTIQVYFSTTMVYRNHTILFGNVLSDFFWYSESYRMRRENLHHGHMHSTILLLYFSSMYSTKRSKLYRKVTWIWYSSILSTNVNNKRFSCSSSAYITLT